MEKRTIDVAASIAMYKANQKQVVPKQCYQNVYLMLTAHPSDFSSKKYRVAFGYMDSGVPGLLLRHAFLLDACDCVVDPTIVAVRKQLREKEGRDCNEPWPEYYIMHVFPDIYDYIDAILKEQKFDLNRALKKQGCKAWEWAQENGFALCG